MLVRRWEHVDLLFSQYNRVIGLQNVGGPRLKYDYFGLEKVENHAYYGTTTAPGHGAIDLPPIQLLMLSAKQVGN